MVSPALAADGTLGEEASLPRTTRSRTENDTTSMPNPNNTNPISPHNPSTSPNPNPNPNPNPSHSPSANPSPSPSPSPNPNMDSVPTSGNEEGDGSGLASRVAWKKLSGGGSGSSSGSSSGNSGGGRRGGSTNSNGSLLMGADSWPALSRVRNGKLADSSPGSGPNLLPNRRIEPPVSEAAAAMPPQPHAEKGRAGHSQRDPGQSTNNAWINNSNNRRNNPNHNNNHNHSLNPNPNPNPNHNHPRVNHGWQAQARGYHGGWDNGAGVGFRQTRVGPRNLPHVGGHVFVSPGAGFINTGNFPNGPGGLYYIPVPPPPPPPPLYPIHDFQFFSHPVPPPGVILPGPDHHATLRAAIVKQIEYYFCVENLCKDIYLRSKMDEDGFVPVSVISRFNRVHKLTQDPTLILDALQNSPIVEVQGDKLRKRHDWSQWLISPNQLVASGMVSTTTSSLQDEGSQQTNSTSSSTVDDRLSRLVDSAEQEGISGSNAGNQQDPCETLTTGDEELGLHHPTNSTSNSTGAELVGSEKDSTESIPGCL